MFITEVLVTNASLNVNQLFSYYSDFYIEKYKRVNVVFAKKRNKAIVVNCFEINDLDEYENTKGYKLIKIIDVIDNEPILSQEQYNLALWLSKTTISPLISCLNTMLPKALRTSIYVKNIVKVKYVYKTNIEYKYTERQKEIYSNIYDGMELKDAHKLSSSIINRFIKDNVIRIEEIEKEYIEKELIDKTGFKELTSKQNEIYNRILNTNKLVSLLYGVTGSGKTEVYLHLARKYIESNKQVLILVPEISLTPQMIKRVKERFDSVVFYHSELNDQERYEQYMRIKNDKVNIVVGTRSSIFLPFTNLGLIIIDEEHDSSYIQDSTPCYNVKNVAMKIANDNKAKVLLASATPSLDSYTRAIKGDYELLELPERINNKFPNVEIVDLTKEIKNRNSYIISDTLRKEIAYALNKDKQSIILLNRRGYAPILKCSECGTTIMCNSCDVPLNYHKDENILKCHQCDRRYKVINKCPKCNGKLIYYGFGTKRVEEELKMMFPCAKIERMDRDNVSRKGSHKEILERFEKKNIDILIGTQMIAKGLDYPDVTVVGILNADSGLAHQDYNSAKMTFDLLMQASGRSGRANTEGKVIIQAFNPEHYVLKAVVAQDYKYFYNIEMNYRNKMHYPPYSHILEVIVQDKNTDRLNKSINFIMEKFENSNIKIYAPIDIPKIKDSYRKRLMLLSKDGNTLVNISWNMLNDYLKTNQLSKIKIQLDPIYLD